MIHYKYDKLVDQVLAKLKDLGADQAEVRLVEEDNFEVYGTAMTLNLVRSIENVGLKISVIKDHRKATAQVNDIEPQGLGQALNRLMEAVTASEPDEANAFSSLPEFADVLLQIGPQPDHFGGMAPLRHKLTDYVAAFLDHTATHTPAIMLSELGGQYNHHKIFLKNSQGTCLKESRGSLNVMTLFNAFDATKSASFNYMQSAPVSLETPICEDRYWRETLERSVKELDPVPFQGPINGNVVFAPCCVAELLYYAQDLALSDDSFIKGFSKWRGQLGQPVADTKLTWRSCPTDPAIGEGYGITGDGFIAEDVVIIEKGILNSYALTLYGANKTGEHRSKNQEGLFDIAPGDKALEAMIAGIERGVLVGRLSGGQPSPNGDFSGIAKNSFLIENGRITQAITEAMASFNLFEVLKDIDALSAERHNSGSFNAPYLLTQKVNIT